MRVPAGRYNVRARSEERRGAPYLLTVLWPEGLHRSEVQFRLREVRGPGGQPHADSAALVHLLDGHRWEPGAPATPPALSVALSGEAFQLWDRMNAELEPFEALLLDFTEVEPV